MLGSDTHRHILVIFVITKIKIHELCNLIKFQNIIFLLGLLI